MNKNIYFSGKKEDFVPYLQRKFCGRIDLQD